jgi:Tfp pilus assembly protein PilV
MTAQPSNSPAERRGRRRLPGSARAFTLVEALAALLVLGIVLVAAFSAMGQGFRLVQTSRDYTRVAQILQSEMEDLRTATWADLEALESANFVEAPLGADFVELFGERYTIYRLVRDRIENGTALADQKEIRVKARWRGDAGDWLEKETVSWYTKNGMHDYYYRSF